MESEKQVDDCCNAWQADHLNISHINQYEAPSSDDDGDDNHQDHDQFFIKFEVEFLYPPALPLEDDSLEDYVLVLECNLKSSTSFHHFWLPCKRFNPENSLSWDDISTILTRIRVPLHKQPFMLHRISSCANEIANADNNRGKKILPMMVSVSVLVDYCYYYQEDESTIVMRNNADINKLMMALPASEGSIEGLKREIILENQENGGAEVKECMICMEKIEVGAQVIGMPCTHFYHQNCILNWLKISNFCPLCHFQLSETD
ncbi:hypothetical protein ACH5RR_007674 [Cinchona calisaya]|uniref:RING-type E3 ubiquitin transferase n=1 Tax=Cinchona calisaya TaxID=153742 RepID=A0ABD3AC11_9GENT